MGRPQRFDLCVIGAGAGGLTVAAGGAQMGASVVLIERHRMGGDCLNFGCVPSKALLAAGHAADTARGGERFGVNAGVPPIDGRRVHAHVHGVIAAIAPHDSVERLERLGVTVIKAHARFSGPDTIEANGNAIRARRFVIASGSTPRLPLIPGLDNVPFLTNETVFDLLEVPRRLVIVGGGSVGVELSQAFRELGAEVTLIEQLTLLPRDDPELVAIVRKQLIALGIEVIEGAQVIQLRDAGSRGLSAVIRGNGQEFVIDGSHLLLAVGRRPSIDGLELDRAGIAFTDRGIHVDSRLRTTNRRVFAVGDVVNGPQLTHAASYQAGIVLRNALFHWPAKADYRTLPHVIYTRPELAQVGLTEAEARALHRDLRILRTTFHDNDRAQAERTTEGLVKVIATRRGRILGAGIVGPAAGELIQTWILAMSRGLGVGAVAAMLAPYPTLGEANKRAAGSFFTPKLFGEGTRRIVRLLARFG